MENRKSSTFNLHCFTAFKNIPSNLIKTFTVDRGTNENTNGLLREFYPKKFDFSSINQEELDSIVTVINNRPRKCLGYRTPAEVFYET